MPKKQNNKNGFSIPRPIIYVGKFLQFISKTLLIKFIFKLFKTPFRFKRPEREQKLYLNSKKEFLLLPGIQKKIRIYKYGESEKKILLIHGWAGRGTQMYKIAETFVSKGYMTISFDATGHGESDGKTSALTEFIPAIMEIEKQYGRFEFAIGHSLGGMAVLNAVKKGLDINKIAIIGSGNSITEICVNFVKQLELKTEVARLLKEKMDQTLGFDTEDLSSYLVARSVTIPTLVIHDKDDKDVQVKEAYNIHENLRNGELLITEGLGHRRVMVDDKVIDKILQFFES